MGWRSSSTKLSRNGTLCAAILAVALAGCGDAPAPDRLQPGQALPGLDLAGLDGGHTPLASYRGRVVVLNVWATWCPPCRKELPSLQRLSARLDPARFAVIGMAGDDDPRVVREYLIDKGVTYTNYMDTGLALATRSFGLKVLPYTVVIAPDGRMVTRLTGERDWAAADTVAMIEAAYAGPGP